MCLLLSFFLNLNIYHIFWSIAIINDFKNEYFGIGDLTQVVEGLPNRHKAPPKRMSILSLAIIQNWSISQRLKC